MDDYRDWWGGMNRKEIVDYFDKGYAPNNFYKYGKSGPNWQSYYVYGQIVPALRSVGVNGFMYVDGPGPLFTGCHTSNNAVRKWIDVATRWIGLCLEANPELQYFHLDGAPNAQWFKYGLGADDNAKFFRVWTKATKRTYPKIQLGGPVSWGAPTRGAGWDGWCKNLIAISHEELDFLDWHDYGSLRAKLEGDGMGRSVQLPKNRAASGAWSGLTHLRVAV